MIDLRFRFDGQGSLSWAANDAETLTQLEQYVHYEASLPPAEQLLVPSFVKMRDTRNALRTYHADWERYEGIRSERRGDFTNEMRRLKRFGKQAISSLKAKYIDNLPRLERWGLTVNLTGRTPTVLMPRSNEEWLAFATACTEMESSLPATERLGLPALGDFRASLNAALSHDQAWRDAWRARQAVHEKRVNLSRRAMFLLRLALANMVEERFGQVLTQEAERWGYRVIWPESEAADDGTSEGASSSS